MVENKLRDYKLYIEDILNAIKKIKNYTRELSFKDFSRDEKTIDAVIRNFEVIGEATRHLPADIRTKHPEIEWKAMINFVVKHSFSRIN